MNRWGFVFDLVRILVLEAELIHDCIFRRLELPWAAIFDCERIPACSVGRGTRCCF
jgi:hypothetical protein